MDKGIGFSRTITLDWLNVTASFCIQDMNPVNIRQHLVETISESVTGKDAQRKTIDVLLAIWVKTERTAPRIRMDALTLFPTLTSSEERMWLHYGMALVCYPFFRNCVSAIGKESRTTEFVSRNRVKDRIASEYGHLGGLDRSVERVMASLSNWGALASTDQKQNYRIQTHQYSSSEILQSWLMTCALFAHPADAIPFDDLTHLPELYPFVITFGSDNLRKDSRFEVHRQGGGLEMIKLLTK